MPASAPLERVNRALVLVAGNKSVDAIVAGPFIANDFPTMLSAALEGLGLAQVPGPIATAALKSGKLVQVLEPFAPKAPGVFLYYPGNREEPFGRYPKNPNSHC